MYNQVATDKINELAQQFIAQHSWATLKWLVLANLLPVLLFAGCYLLIMLLARRSQVDQWCEQNPRIAGLLKLLRGIGLDPWLIIQAISLLIRAKLPAYLSRLLPVSVFALALLACSMSLEAARTKGTVIKTGQVNLPAYMTANRTECENLDSIQRYWGYGAITTGPIAPLAAGVAAVPGIGDGGKNAMLITAGVAGAITVFELAEQNNFANQWAQQCSQAVAP